MRQERIRKTPRRRERHLESSPLATLTYVPDTSAADQVLEEIAQILEVM